MMHSPANGLARGAAPIRIGFAFLFVLFLVFSAPVWAADGIGPQLRARIEKARPQLGDLPPWQEEIFQNEVLSSSGRFVRDYRTSGNQVTKADVDLEGIKRYLAFHASQLLKGNSTKTLLFVRANAACQDCAKAVGTIRTELKTRLERRGLDVLLASGDELKRDPSEAFAKRNAQGWVLAEVRAEDDPDHPGDQRYGLMLDFRFPGTAVSGVQKQMEILPSDSIEISMSRLAIDAVLELGQKARSGFASANSEDAGVEIFLEGASQFPILKEVKTKLQTTLGPEYRVVEKRIERGGRSSIAIHASNPGEKSTESLAQALRKTAYDGFVVHISNIGTNEISARIAATAGGRR
jgi:hypothetical protein